MEAAAAAATAEEEEGLAESRRKVVVGSVSCCLGVEAEGWRWWRSCCPRRIARGRTLVVSASAARLEKAVTFGNHS